jgi:hypothetical protein
MNKPHQISVNEEQLQHVLEPLIRRVIREELSRVVQQEPGVFYLRPEMPLYEDMEDIAERKASQSIELFSHQEVWNE